MTPGKRLRDFSWGAGTNHAWNTGGDKIWTSMFGFGNVTLPNQWYMGAQWEFDPPHLDDRMTRGGPLAKQPTQYGGYFYGGTDSRRRVPLGLNAGVFLDPRGGYDRNIFPNADIRPSSNIKISISPGIDQLHNTLQFVQSVADPSATVTYGRRYVFADLYQTTFSANTRVEWTLTRALSLQMFAQPFAASGHYNNFKELARPASGDYPTYGSSGSSISPVTANGVVQSYTVDPDGAGSAPAFTISNPDFRVHSLRGNAVVRWEYRPGSTLFFVWQQQRSAFDQYVGDFNFSRDTRAIFAQPTNVFLIKATYWLAR
jgi:hypothetical protein